MNDFTLQKDKAKEKMLEAMLEYAGACHAEDIANEMQAKDEIEAPITYPPELDSRIRRLISIYNVKESFRRLRETTARIFPKVAIFFFAFFIGFAIMVTSVEAFRVKVLNFIIDVGKEYTSIDLKEKKQDIPREDTLEMSPEWKGVNTPSYIPEGFEISKMESLSFTKIVNYINDNGQLIVFQQYDGENTNLRIDTESSVMEKILINDIEGFIVKKDDRTTIIWHNNNLSFSLASDLDKDELIKMAQSIKVLE